eukprot:5266474-Heterocapsa_arctica.AAC.1
MSSVMGSSSMSVTVLTDPPIALADGRPQRAGQSFSVSEPKRARVPYDIDRLVGDAQDLLQMA